MTPALPPDAEAAARARQERIERLARKRAAAQPASRAGTSRTAASRTITSNPSSSQRSAPPRKRRHAAQGSRMTALAVSMAATGALSGYLAMSDHAAASPLTSTSTGASAGTGATATSTAGAAAQLGATATTGATTTTGLKDGGYTGSTVNTKFGPVQVQVTIAGGKITNVSALQTPGGRQKSIDINQQAVPILTSETLAAQSAKIDNVSGATYTSNGYVKSLQSALDLAKTTTASA
jgi:uncharacterized protein with FMN-binding domain